MDRSGFAHTYCRFSRDYIAEEAEAKRERGGLWASFNLVHPEEWRRPIRAGACVRVYSGKILAIAAAASSAIKYR
jgi:hypothetical protein